MCGGDFNEILSANEKIGGSGKVVSGMRNFWQAIDDCGLVDPGFASPTFTWNNNRDGCSNVQERLDRILVDIN